MSKRENVWNQLLFEKSRLNGIINKNLIILGRKGAGKRTLVDALVAETQKSQFGTKAGSLRNKGVTPIVDYTYVDVVDLRDPDNQTNARLNVHLLEEDSQKYLLSGIVNHQTIRNTFIAIALDLQEPWTFMEDLDKWVSVIQDLLSELKLTLQELEDMKANVQQYMAQMDGEQVIPHDGLLKTNLGIPIMVLVNKSDILEREDKGKDWDSKGEIIQFCLRQFCVDYGATLLFTSVRQKTNLKIMYEYILHRLYNMPFDIQQKNLSDFESLFIPLGQDDQNIIKSTFSKLAQININYEESIPIIQQKKNQLKEELIVEDDQEFFSKLKEKSQQTTITKPILPIQVPLIKQENTEQSTLSARGSQQTMLKDFYDKILTGKNDQSIIQTKDNVQLAHQQLHDRMKQKSETTIIKPGGGALFNSQDQQKLQKILPNMQEKANLDAVMKIKSTLNKQ